jgi:hypothetical protein
MAPRSRLSSKVADPEQNSPLSGIDNRAQRSQKIDNSADPSIFVRVASLIFEQRHHSPPEDKSETEFDPVNANLFPRYFRDANDQDTYTKAESEQASARLWSVYIAEAQRYDEALVVSWRADMEGMLIFVGLIPSLSGA